MCNSIKNRFFFFIYSLSPFRIIVQGGGTSCIFLALIVIPRQIYWEIYHSPLYGFILNDNQLCETRSAFFQFNRVSNASLEHHDQCSRVSNASLEHHDQCSRVSNASLEHHDQCSQVDTEVAVRFKKEKILIKCFHWLINKGGITNNLSNEPKIFIRFQVRKS